MHNTGKQAELAVPRVLKRPKFSNELGPCNGFKPEPCLPSPTEQPKKVREKVGANSSYRCGTKRRT